MVGRIHLDHLTVTRSPIPDNPLDIDDMAAMNANEPVAIKPLFNVADGQGTKELVRPIEDVGVVRIGVNGDHVLHGNEISAPVPLDRELAGGAPGRSAAAAH